MKAWSILVAVALATVMTACGGSDNPTVTPTVEALQMPKVEPQVGALGTVAQNGDKVSVHYTGTLDEGEIFDTSRNGDVFMFTIGSGEVISGFNSAVLGLAVGQSLIRPMASVTRALSSRPQLIRCPRG